MFNWSNTKQNEKFNMLCYASNHNSHQWQTGVTHSRTEIQFQTIVPHIRPSAKLHTQKGYTSYHLRHHNLGYNIMYNKYYSNLKSAILASNSNFAAQNAMHKVRFFHFIQSKSAQAVYTKSKHTQDKKLSNFTKQKTF